MSSSFEGISNITRHVTEMNLITGIDLTMTEIKRIKKEHELNLSHLELMEEIKEKRTKYPLGKVYIARYEGASLVCRMIAPLHATNWLIEDFCKDAAVFM